MAEMVCTLDSVSWHPAFRSCFHICAVCTTSACTDLDEYSIADNLLSTSLVHAWECLVFVSRRLHQIEAEGEGGEHAAAAAAARASPEAISEAAVAAQALAVLVRLTAHSGALMPG